MATGQPVASRALVERAGLDVSASTVRGELAELERRGLLIPPHVGRAGAHRPRVPVLRRPPGAARAAAGGVSAGSIGRGAQRAGDGAAVDDGHALGADATARTGVGARGRDRDRAPRGGAAVAAARRHDRGHHVRRLGDEATVSVRAQRRPGPRRVGGLLSQRAGRRHATRVAEAQALPRGLRPLGSRAVVPRHPIRPVLEAPVADDQRMFVGGAASLLDDEPDEPGHIAACSSCWSAAGRCSTSSPLRSTRGGRSSGSATSSAIPCCRSSRRGIGVRPLDSDARHVSLLGPRRMDYERAIRSVRAAASELSRLRERVRRGLTPA